MKNEVIDLLNSINKINVELANYVDFDIHVIAYESDAGQLKLKITKQLVLTFVEPHYGWLVIFLRNLLKIHQDKLAYVRNTHQGYYVLEKDTNFYVYTNRRAVRKDDAHWQQLIYFNFNYWELLSYLCKLLTVPAQQPSGAFNRALLEQLVVNNNKLMDILNMFEHWVCIAMVIQDDRLCVSPNYAPAAQIQLVNLEHCINLAHHVVYFNQQAVDMARHYLNVAALWTFDKWHHKWVTTTAGQKILENIKIYEILNGVR